MFRPAPRAFSRYWIVRTSRPEEPCWNVGQFQSAGLLLDCVTTEAALASPAASPSAAPASNNANADSSAATLVRTLDIVSSLETVILALIVERSAFVLLD